MTYMSTRISSNVIEVRQIFPVRVRFRPRYRPLTSDISVQRVSIVRLKDRVAEVVRNGVRSAEPRLVARLRNFEGFGGLADRNGERYELLLRQNERGRAVVEGHVAVPIAVCDAIQHVYHRLLKQPEMLRRHADVYITVKDVDTALAAAIDTRGLPVLVIVCQNMGFIHEITLPGA